MCLKVMPTPTSTDRAGTGNMESSNERNPRDDSKDPPVNVDDDIEPASEVKVYTNEDEDDEVGLPETENSLSRRDKSIEDVKSGLINESEQCKDARTGDQLAFARTFLHEATLHQYLLNQQAASYALLGRPSFWENALTGGSPASAAATHPGLRPSLYHLPPHPPHGQYPYPMLGPAQLEAWHQYQSGALRAGSPYSLPITSGSMSRFSPGGLLGHHPGLSPAGSGPQGGHPHLPHIKQDLDAVSNVNHHLNHHGSSHSGRAEKESKKKDVNHIKKPLNAFMLYMKEMRPVVQAECTLKESAAINQILGRRWHDLSREEQQKYYEKARSARQLHMEMYPHWNARDNYRFGLKKKKRKRDKSDDPGGGMKKCRARYGLDQQDTWCKPCRRKKKCIRVQSYLEGKGSGGGGGSSGSQSGGAGQPGQAGQPGSRAGHNNVATPAGSSGNNHGRGPMGSSTHDMFNHSSKPHSDGEEDDIDDLDDDDHSPDSRSLGSTSEQSLTSPAGFSSLNSLGSPASIASPSTPQTLEASGDFLRGASVMGYGAFKPPSMPASTATSTTPAGYQPPGLPQLPPSQAQQQPHLHPMFPHHRPPVGTDPKDSKNPFSITNLTGNYHHQIPHHLPHHHVSHHPGGPGSIPGAHAGPDKRALPLMT